MQTTTGKQETCEDCNVAKDAQGLEEGKVTVVRGEKGAGRCLGDSKSPVTTNSRKPGGKFPRPPTVV